MRKILLLCPERLGHQNPAGVGIRFLEFARALVADGHDVTMLSADGGDVPGCRCEKSTPEAIARLSREHDAVIVQGHIANELFVHGARIPTVVDLYDPFIVENFHYYGSLGEQVFRHDHATLMRSLQEGDFFLCASADQRLFYLGALLVAGRLNPETFDLDGSLDHLLAVVPFGVPPVRPPAGRDLNSPAILFGGIYDWYEPRIAIDAVVIARKSIPELTLTFTRHPNPEGTPQSKYVEATRYVKERGYGGFVFSEDWTAYADRAKFYARFAAALLTFRASLETELAMRTRLFDYLWAGIPVITSSAPGTDPLLRRYDAGIVVESDDPMEYSDALVSLLKDSDLYTQKVLGTQAYAADHQWPRLLEPLLHFCRNPRIEETKYKFNARRELGQTQSIIERLGRRLRVER